MVRAWIAILALANVAIWCVYRALSRMDRELRDYSDDPDRDWWRKR